jgi:hypothetical protein
LDELVDLPLDFSPRGVEQRLARVEDDVIAMRESISF